jgi:RNA polymerase sigma-70 factor (ECF subfamily)
MTAATAVLLAAARSPADARVRALVDAYHEPIWRFLLRMGVDEAHVEDAAQNVFLVFAQRADAIEPAVERSFLFGTALRVASDYRRHGDRRAEAVDAAWLDERAHPAPDAEHQLARRELRALLDRVLDELPCELRAVFVLAELEETTMAAIARLLSIPPGTVASRLRRARELFAAKAEELRRELAKEGDAP